MNAVKAMKQKLRRAMAALLALALMCTLLPAVVPEAHAESWAQPYVDQLARSGVMRDDIPGGMDPDGYVTRAEFVSMVNRAFGYTKTGPTPFKDVFATAWYADDIAIAYTAGYISGTSPTTASPNATLTREQATYILGKNAMLRETTGEVLGFTDSRSFSDWSRGMIDAAAQAGMVGGYPDGTFQPQREVTRGEVACMLVNVLGDIVQGQGAVSLGDVDGNVTINHSGVTLKDTFITGNLYLTGGIGLGDVLLDNVTVLGKIIASGAGEGNQGDSSIILRHVNANEMVVDTINNQFVTIRAEGATRVDSTSVRTPSYLEDVTPEKYGLLNIKLDGEAGTRLQLAGNVKEVVNRTPSSSLLLAQGTADKITVDESAVNAQLTIDSSARVKDLNLDVGTVVSGGGDIDDLTVYAPGSTVSTLPNTVTVRPGVTANVAGENMDTVAAAESSEDPRLLSGYPAVRNVAPTTAEAVFSTNKRGTIYWALTALADGSVSEDDLIRPPAYGGAILKSGSITAAASKTEYPVRLTGLVTDGSYYISAVMVDNRGERSPLKVAAFTTPDSTTPNFAAGYPRVSLIESDRVWVDVMPNKSCQLYYAVLAQGATAPTVQNFKTGSISGAYGYGVRDVTKNVADSFQANNRLDLEELKNYDIYLCLVDADGGKNSAVKKLSFTSGDGTPPTIQYMDQGDPAATSVKMNYALDEQGTLYWAIVPQGEEFLVYTTEEGLTLQEKSEEAKKLVASGRGALKKGSSSVSGARAGDEVSYAISSLNAKSTGTSAYDLYYVARDKAGLWSEKVEHMTVYTLDESTPTVIQKFTSFNAGQTETTTTPLADTDIRLVFSKAMQIIEKDDRGRDQMRNLLELYDSWKRGNASDGDTLLKALRANITMYQVPAIGSPVVVTDRSDKTKWKDGDDWTIDFEKVRIYMDGTDMVIEFPNNQSKTFSAQNLKNGAEYYFVLSAGFRDTTPKRNPLGRTTLPRFITMRAQINISPPGITTLVEGSTDSKDIVDFSFQFDPKSTGTSPENIYYDIMIWSDTSMKFNLYRRYSTSSSTWSEWKEVANTNTNTADGAFEYTVPSGQTIYNTVSAVTRGASIAYTYDKLSDLKEGTVYQYAVHIVTLGDTNKDRGTWNFSANLSVTVASGAQQDLNNVAGKSGGAQGSSYWYGDGTAANPGAPKDLNSGVSSIGNPDPFSRTITISDTKAPVLSGIYPTFTPYDTLADMNLLLNNPGTIYYVVTPLACEYEKNPDGTIKMEDNLPVVTSITDNPVPANKNTLLPNKYDYTTATGVPGGGAGVLDGKDSSGNEVRREVALDSPGRDTIISTKITDDRVRQGSIHNNGRTTSTIRLTDLQPDTYYYVYLMFQGNSTSAKAVCYKFRTKPLVRPVLTLTPDTTNSSLITASVDRTAEVYARLLYEGTLDSLFTDDFCYKAPDNPGDTDIVNTDRLNAAGQAAASKNPTPAWREKDYSVWQAMRDSVGSQGTASVFDAYASTDLKNQVANTIRSGATAAGMSMWGPETISMGGDKTMTFNLADRDATYLCVAVARSPQGGEDAFRAAYPIRAVDRDAPVLVSADVILKPDTKTDADGKVVETGTASGIITLNYNKYLYRTFGVTQYPVMQTAAFGSPNDGTAADNKADGLTFCGLAGWFNETIFYKILNSGVAARTSSITLEVKKLPLNNFSISVPAGVCNSNGVTSLAYSVAVTVNRNSSTGQYTFTTKITKG